MVKKCIQCGKDFELTGAEADYYKEKGLEIPTRCRACRQSNRLSRNNISVPRGKARRKQRKTALRSVPPAVFAVLVAIIFVYLTIARGGSHNAGSSNPQSTSPANVQDAVMFRTEALWKEHFNKHGKDMGYESAEDYLAGANAVIQDSSALHKTEKKDGDDVYFVEATNDLVIVSTDGYIRTYFRPEDGKKYYDRQ